MLPTFFLVITLPCFGFGGGGLVAVFAAVWLVVLLTVQVAAALGTAISALFFDMKRATAVTIVVMFGAMAAGGFFVDLEVHERWHGVCKNISALLPTASNCHVLLRRPRARGAGRRVAPLHDLLLVEHGHAVQGLAPTVRPLTTSRAPAATRRARQHLGYTTSFRTAKRPRGEPPPLPPPLPRARAHGGGGGGAPAARGPRPPPPPPAPGRGGGGGGGGSLRRREVTAPHLDGAPGFEVLTAGYSFSSAPALVDAAVLVGFAVFYRAVAFVALKRTKKLKFT